MCADWLGDWSIHTSSPSSSRRPVRTNPIPSATRRDATWSGSDVSSKFADTGGEQPRTHRRCSLAGIAPVFCFDTDEPGDVTDVTRDRCLHLANSTSRRDSNDPVVPHLVGGRAACGLHRVATFEIGQRRWCLAGVAVQLRRAEHGNHLFCVRGPKRIETETTGRETNSVDALHSTIIAVDSGSPPVDIGQRVRRCTRSASRTSRTYGACGAWPVGRVDCAVMSSPRPVQRPLGRTGEPPRAGDEMGSSLATSSDCAHDPDLIETDGEWNGEHQEQGRVLEQIQRRRHRRCGHDGGRQADRETHDRAEPHWNR